MHMQLEANLAPAVVNVYDHAVCTHLKLGHELVCYSS